MDGCYHCPFCDTFTRRINGCVTHLERKHKLDIEIYEDNEKKKAKAKYYARKKLAENECSSGDLIHDMGMDLSSEDGIDYPEVLLSEKQEQHSVKDKQYDERTEKEIDECIESVVNEERSDIMEEEVEVGSIVLREDGD